MHTKADLWEGLQPRDCVCAGRKTLTALVLPRSVLLLHRQGGRAIEVCASAVTWRYTARAGCFDYYPAGTYDFVTGAQAPMRATGVDIPIAFEMSVLEEGHWGAELTPRFQFRDRRLEGLVQSLVHASGSAMAPADAVLLSVAVVDRLYETAHHAAKALDDSPIFTPTVRRLIVEYIDQHIGTPIDVDKVAFLTGLARTPFGKVFRASFELPLHQYVIARKIRLASKRLLDDVRVTELSHELGFSSHAHFATVFRQHTGLTPSEFRRDRRRAEETPEAQ